MGPTKQSDGADPGLGERVRRTFRRKAAPRPLLVELRRVVRAAVPDSCWLSGVWERTRALNISAWVVEHEAPVVSGAKVD